MIKKGKEKNSLACSICDMRKPETYIKNKLIPPKKFFEDCLSYFPVYIWENKQQKIISSERKNAPIIKKRLTKKSRLSFFGQYKAFAIILVTKKRIEIQTYSFSTKFNDGKEQMTYELTNFEQFANNQHIKITKIYDTYDYGLSPHFSSSMGGFYTGVEIYHNSWQERIKTISELKYLEFYQLYRENIAHLYKYRNEIEFLQKIKADTLARDVFLSKNVDMRTINMKWLKANKQFFKNSNRRFELFELERRIKLRNGKLVQGIEKYLSYKDINKIPKSVGIISFQKWLIRNDVAFAHYLDYLRMLKELNYDMNIRKLILPDDFKTKHDETLELLLKKQKEIKEHDWKKRLKNTLKFERKINDYCFVVPKKISDLIEEGKCLSHCVGLKHYIDGHINGEHTIVFMRKKEQVDTPFFTIEYRNKKIYQLYGYENEKPSEEIKNIAEKWLQTVAK